MITTWEYSENTEAMRLLHDAHDIANGFFRLNQFYVLPYAQNAIAGNNIVLVPDLPYLSIPRFWDRVSRFDINAVPPDLLTQTEKLLKTAQLPTPDYQNFKKSWTKIEEQVLAEIYRLIPEYKDSIKSILIRPTNIGTSCSFNVCDPTSKACQIELWVRSDQQAGSIVEGILSSLTFDDASKHLHALWGETEMIVDWLLAYSPLTKLLPKTPKTIKSIRTISPAGVIDQSRVFLTKIGAPQPSIGKIDTSGFSPSERKLLTLLQSKSPNIVSFDELASADPDKFSLQAVAKSIQRLRDRLEKSGVSGSFIQTKRGEGYLLTN